MLWVTLQVDRLREKVREKENDAESKDKLVSGAQTEKKRLEAELAELRDHMDIKERKINVLQRKVNLLYSTWNFNLNMCTYL